ncbi:N-6 DNA methylase [Francisella tularensis]|uniref:N-6 DNA methylase n=1 Tax=Francisella tularensis TaxID=263 RepID=UPI0008F540AE|nr:N-6 DNA methylase [Francisella tularensis]APA83347.1 Type I restriction-modification system, DNA-methyltransferase subunit M / Type I restriction-modification system, specificity subunit S [Francisella tularensis subsp. novicida PA10-7858]
MITKNNLVELLKTLEFIESDNKIYTKQLNNIELKIDFKNQRIAYPENTNQDLSNPNGIIINDNTTTNFSSPENFVVFECVHRLLEKGYKAENIELEPQWKLGHTRKGGKADILIKDNQGIPKIIIECKTEGKEHSKAWADTERDGGQLFSYKQQAGSTEYGILYSSDLIDGKVIYRNEIITYLDNKQFLAEEETHKERKLFKNATSAKEIFHVWKETYSQDYQTKGFFEPEIKLYEVGKNKYTIKDLQTLSFRDIQKKYNEFATILRKYNVSGRENAFDKLVNLFLCKLVDESNGEINQNEELKFYWKGSTIDNAFDLQDRLQSLYQIGMKKFLKEDVTYIKKSDIDNAFRFVKNDPDATKETIEKYFNQLKFFTNNDFAFIDVHNEKLFYQNFAVLLEVVRMFQDISLKTKDDNQFLGDLFEGFLDQGVKQSEGQFFTPMPIVRFIISALPLEQIIKADGDEKPKVIDYACGSGHFLNEYASQLKGFIKDENELNKYYANIYGIEKEYRLSKVAKVSTFMYGQDDVNILYADGLVEHEKIKEGSYSILIANPPYSVKGFLDTLTQEQRQKYSLITKVDEKSYATNNNIQSFFIERTKQLLKAGGVAAIILPSSIISNADGLHIATRELILKYFDLLAVVEFGSGTFGKTGTNTVTLFLRKREENPTSAEHYQNRVNAWFNGKDTKVYQDENLLKAYCNHLDYSFAEYREFLEATTVNSYTHEGEHLIDKNLNDRDSHLYGNDYCSIKIFQHENFISYKQAFENLTEIKNLQKQRAFKNKTQQEQQLELDKRFYSYVKELEKDKVYYFIMAYLNQQKVVIVKSPNKNADIKKFLGYEWSSSKGSEGIKYLASQTAEIDSDVEEELETDDKQVLENLQTINHINTPLYNPQNLADESKINSIIRANFESYSHARESGYLLKYKDYHLRGNDSLFAEGGESKKTTLSVSDCHSFKEGELTIPTELSEYVSTARLVDMLDFEKTDFKKIISTTPKQNIQIETKWDLVRLGDIADPKGGNTFQEKYQGNTNVNDIPFFKVSDMNLSDNIIYMVKSNNYVSQNVLIDEIKATIFDKGTVIFPKVGMSIHTNKKRILSTEAAIDNNTMALVIHNKDKVSYKYLFEYFDNYINLSDIASNANPPSISATNLKNIKIPLPPLEVQQQIVSECEAVDAQVEKAKQDIESAKRSIEDKFNEILKTSLKEIRLSDSIFDISIGRRILKKEINENSIGLPAYSANVFEPFGYIEKDLLKDFSKPSVIWGIDGDWMVNYIEQNKPFYPTDHCGVLRVNSKDINSIFLAKALEKEGQRVRFSRSNRASMEAIKGLRINLPVIDLQSEYADLVTNLEKTIVAAQATIDRAKDKKAEIVKKYL